MTGRATLFSARPRPKEGDTFRQVTVSETTFEWRVDVDGQGDWYVIKGPRVVAQCPTWKELGHE